MFFFWFLCLFFLESSSGPVRFMYILTLLNCDIFIASKLLSLPEWLQSLILCCFEVSDFDIQSSAVRTLLDLINLTLSVTAGHMHKDRPSAPVVVIPMISQQSLGVIENSDLYEVRYLRSECNLTVSVFGIIKVTCTLSRPIVSPRRVTRANC